MRRWSLVLLAVLLMCGIAHAENTYFEQFLTLDTCEHQWYPISASNVVLEEGVTVHTYETQAPEVYIAVGSYHAAVRYVMNRCALCGVEQSMPEARNWPHHYRVIEEALVEDAVTLTYTCNECGHVRRETLSLTELRSVDPASDAVDCMHGGACLQAGLFTEAEIGRRTVLDGQTYYLTRVLVEEDGQLVSKVARRLHCPFCRRPHLQHVSRIDESWEGYDELPEMTYAEFMAVQTEDNLPYAVIDRWRNIQ